MFCPKCRNGYQEGFFECADCHVNLVSELAPIEIPAYLKPVVIFTTSNVHESSLVKSFLEGSGITVFEYDSNVARLNPFYTNAIGGIRLAVDEDDVSRAKELLAEYNEGKGGTTSAF